LLPGCGFSGPTTESGGNRYRIAKAWAELMARLGYERHGAVGNDGGSMISAEVGRIAPEHAAGVHLTQLYAFPSGDPAEMAPERGQGSGVGAPSGSGVLRGRQAADRAARAGRVRERLPVHPVSPTRPQEHRLLAHLRHRRHYAAHQATDLLVADLTTFFAALR
jgi:pimeloyl-ACP methyl ester carboxylesterase